MDTDWKNKFKPERKTDWNDIANFIHDSVEMEELIRLYCPSLPIRRNRCPCPIHNGKDKNFSFTKSGYKCFVCGASGDAITFVQEICSLSSRADAMKRINSDFNLHLPIESEGSEIFRIRANKLREEAERKRAEQQAWSEKYDALIAEYAELDKARMGDPSSESYADAVKRIDYVSFLIDKHLENEPR